MSEVQKTTSGVANASRQDSTGLTDMRAADRGVVEETSSEAVEALRLEGDGGRWSLVAGCNAWSYGGNL